MSEVSGGRRRPATGEAGADCVGLVLAQDPRQMALIPDEGAVEEFAAASPDPAFGDRVLTIFTPSVAKISSNARLNVASRSQMTKRNEEIRPPRSKTRLRACWAVHAPSGLAVTPRMCTRRVANS